MASAVLAISPAHAQTSSMPTTLGTISPGMGKIERRLNTFQAANLVNGEVVTRPYRDNNSEPIYMRVGRTTTLQFQPDETLTDVMYDDRDALEDHITADRRKLTIRLKRLTTVPGTAVTTKRSYFFVLTPTELPNVWYQGISFAPNDSHNPFGTSLATGEGRNATIAEAAPISSPNNDVFSGAPNFNYTVQGDANFKPVAVYDNGRFTWIQMAANVQTMPAVFEIGANGMEVVNWTPINNGTGLLVNRLMPKFVLKLGPTEVTVVAGKGR